MPEIDRLFRHMMEGGGSDLHLREGMPPAMRQHGHVVAFDHEEKLTRKSIRKLLRGICPADYWDRFERTGDLDFAYAMGKDARFRANYYRQMSGYAAVFRIIPTKILTLDQLGAPESFKSLGDTKMGLILVTGPTGSGKSTTLAAILDYINDNYRKKIVTIEDPIEFIQPTKQSVFLQREVHVHTDSFASGLRAAGREDCDVILVGEMRDLETISLAVSAAEMGVLVFGTLHTNSAAKTIDRIVNVFPHDQQEQIKSMLSTSLRAVISQQLLRTKDGNGRVAAFEILVNNSAVTAAIRQGHIAKLNQIIQSNQRMGMMTMDDALMKHYEAGTVTAEAVYMKAIDKHRFEGLADAERGDDEEEDED